MAVRELWEKLAAHEGLDLRKHHLGADDDQSAEEQAGRCKLDERLGELRDEAQLRILGLVWVGEVRAWIGDGENWRRPTEQVLREKLTGPPDEPIPFYLDRTEVNAVAEARWSAELTSMLPTSQHSRSEASRRSRGRPPASGTYAKSDAPILQEMRTLVESGEELSVTAAAQKLASSARGPATLESKATRLRKAYFEKWPPEE